MKKLILISAISIFFIQGCGESTPPIPEPEPVEVNSEKLVIRKGITYEINSTIPFTGSSVAFHENGQISMRQNYQDGLVHGLGQYFHENGQLGASLNYTRGKEDGLEERYTDNGEPLGSGNWINGLKDGEHRFIYENGTPMTTGDFTMGDGFEERYFEGALSTRTNYKNGKEDGLKESYFDGYLSSRNLYKNGVRVLHESVNEDGFVTWRTHYKNEKQDGWSEFFINDCCSWRWMMKNDLKDGPYELFNQIGELEKKEFYWNDLKHGPSTALNKDTGEWDLINCYEKGNEVDHERCDEEFWLE